MVTLDRAISGIGFAYAVFDSAIGISTGKIKNEDAAFNVGLGTISLKMPWVGSTYGTVELLHPGGWAGWRESSSNLYKEIGHTKHGDQVFFCPKL